MTLVELKYLLALAQEGHFGRAAKQCHVSQPTLSVAINKLENRLDICIFERQKGQIQITEIGEKLITQAKRVLEEAEKLKDLADGSKHQLDSPLKLGGIYTIAPYLFPAIIPKLKKLAPNMPLLIQEDFTANLRVKLQRGELDALFVALPFNEPSVVVKPLFEEEFVVLLPKEHPLAKKESIAKEALRKETTLLLGKGHCFRDQILKTCPQCYTPDDLQQTVEGTSLETLRHMVASGMGITILPKTATQVKHYSNTLCVRPFQTKGPKRTVALAWRASFPRTQAIDALIAALNQAKLK
jgi:LysR family transcriptional regulator, hydrogen peroxide-inducible genes activator